MTEEKKTEKCQHPKYRAFLSALEVWKKRLGLSEKRITLLLMPAKDCGEALATTRIGSGGDDPNAIIMHVDLGQLATSTDAEIEMAALHELVHVLVVPLSDLVLRDGLEQWFGVAQLDMLRHANRAGCEEVVYRLSHLLMNLTGTPVPEIRDDSDVPEGDTDRE